jgi:hypothetical protein
MFREYLEKYKHVSDETFAYTVKTSFEQRQEFINDTVKCLRYIADTFEKLPSNSVSLKFIFDDFIYFIKRLEVPIEQIHYELKSK